MGSTSNSNIYKESQFGEIEMYSKRLKLERLNVYERLSKCSDNERETIYEMFSISLSNQKKKQTFARKLWDSYAVADESALFILGMNDESRQLGFNSIPSRKGLKRFGMTSLPTPSPIFISSISSDSQSAWVQGLLEKRIKYDLTQTIHACI